MNETIATDSQKPAQQPTALLAKALLATALLRDVAVLPLPMLSDDDLQLLLRQVEEPGRLIDALRASTAAEIENRSRPELGNDGRAKRMGHSKSAHLVEHITRVSQAEAMRRIRLGTAVRARAELGGHQLPPLFPSVATALMAGTLGVDSAHVIIRCLDQAARHADPGDLAAAESGLVHTASLESADLVAVHALAYREALDPDGSEPRDEELRMRRAFTIGREVNGMAKGIIHFNPQSTAMIRAILSEARDPARKPRFLPEDDRAFGTTTTSTPDGELVETLTDPRTREQRQFDVLMGTLAAGFRTGETGNGTLRSTATVMAVVQLKDLENGSGVGWLDDVTEPVSMITMQTIACDSGYRRIVLGHSGEVLHLGRAERLFSAAQRKALAVRDGGCVWPGCTAPPSWCEAHHVIEYEHGGTTDIDNGVLLCSAHHHMMHASAYFLKMIRGKPWLLAPPSLDPDRAWKPLGKTRALMTALRR